jgi:hypothetical protein
MQYFNAASALLVAGALFLGMLLAMEFGRRRGQRRLARDPDGAHTGLGAVEGAVFGLMGLLIAFTFSGAATRFDERRGLVVSEANAVSTAWARLDMLPEQSQSPLRDQFRRHLDARLEIYRALPDETAAKAAFSRAAGLQQEIWNAAVAVCRTDEGRPLTMLLLPALNEMFDITTTRAAALRKHPPFIVFAMLFGLSLSCALLAGYGMASGRRRGWAHMIGFALIVAAAIYVILDLEHPRAGLIRVDAADQPLVKLRKNME